MRITTIGIDLAKNIFQVHGVTKMGLLPLTNPCTGRRCYLPFFSKLNPCLIGTEACSSAHYWGREVMVGQWTQLSNTTSAGDWIIYAASLKIWKEIFIQTCQMLRWALSGLCVGNFCL